MADRPTPCFPSNHELVHEGSAPRENLLRAGSPRAVLEAILNGDPLGVRPAIADALRHRALFLDADRVLLRSLARCARDADRFVSGEDLDAWVVAQVERAIDDVLREGFHAIDGPDGRGVPPAFRELAEPLGLDADRMRQACCDFHRLPFQDREAFFLLVVEGRGLDESSSILGITPTRTACSSRRALDCFLGDADQASDQAGGSTEKGAVQRPGASHEQ